MIIQNNVPSGQMHSFRVDGTQIAKINSAGITISSSLAATQSWVQSQNYLTTLPTFSSITETGTSALKTVSIDNGTGNTFTTTQPYNAHTDTCIQFNKVYVHWLER